MKKAQQKPKMCVYCNEEQATTRDHIPPKNLFAKGQRPNDLITVPCCQRCNNIASKDDEYFRQNVVFREDTPLFSGAKEVFSATIRGLERPDHQGLKKDLQNRTYLDDKFSAGGIYIGPVLKYDVDAERMDGVAKRIVRGLFYKEFCERLHDEYVVSAFSVVGDRNVPLELQDEIAQIKKQPEMLVGNGNVFTCRYRSHRKIFGITQWILTFYRKTEFLGFTLPE